MEACGARQDHGHSQDRADGHRHHVLQDIIVMPCVALGNGTLAQGTIEDGSAGKRRLQVPPSGSCRARARARDALSCRTGAYRGEAARAPLAVSGLVRGAKREEPVRRKKGRGLSRPTTSTSNVLNPHVPPHTRPQRAPAAQRQATSNSRIQLQYWHSWCQAGSNCMQLAAPARGAGARGIGTQFTSVTANDAGVRGDCPAG